MAHFFTHETTDRFQQYLTESEKAPATIEKYLRDLRSFISFAGEEAVTAETIIRYKAHLLQQLKPTSINSILSALNHFFSWCGWNLRARQLKIQHQLFRAEEQELSREDYVRLLDTARSAGKEQLWLVMQTLCGTGIRVSELRFITVEAVRQGKTSIQCKGKNRTILIPRQLQGLLLGYALRMKRTTGPVFVTRAGNPLDRSNIWRALKSLCEAAGVLASKVFPHNLRHLFAATFYEAAKDIAKLADVLGHSSIDTTRIYITTSGSLHRQIIERLGLIQTDVPSLTT